MGPLSNFFHMLMHPNNGQLSNIIHQYGAWTYAILFLIVFCETGLIVTPFLPGDSLLLVGGSMAFIGALNPWLLCVVIVCAALCGDNANYFVGRTFGAKLFTNEKSKFFNKRNLDRTHQFFEKFGGRTIIVARFLPVLRTFAPFVAGMGNMQYRQFIVYSVTAALLWVSLFVSIGYFASKWAENHMGMVLIAILVISTLPTITEFFRHLNLAKQEKAQEAAKAAAPTVELEEASA